MTTLTQADYFTTAQQAMRKAKSQAELDKAAHLMDQPEFNALTDDQRLELGFTYSQRHFQLAGALVP